MSKRPVANRPPLVADRRYSKRKAKPRGRGPRRAARRGSLARRLWRGARRLIWAALWRAGLVALVVLALAVGYTWSTLPDASALLDARARGSVTLLDRAGGPYAWRGDQFGGAISARTVSPHLKNAIVATEDKRFYRHIGISPRGIASAVRINLSEGRGPLSGHGGSTITQQTAKLLCLGRPFDPGSGQTEAAYEADCRRGTVQRKLHEAIYALALELKFTKDEILTIYMNRAFLGAGARGFEAAAQRYFGKSAAQVSPPEAAMLAGLLVAPTRFAPTNDLARSQNRAATVLRLMSEQGYLTDAQYAEATANPAQLSQAAAARAGGYFADWVMASGPEFFTRETTEDVIIRTTFDPAIQRAAETAVAEIFETKVKPGSTAQAAVVVMSADGAVRAMVGGRGNTVPGAFNRATQALRQTGSAFKPFVYAAALDLGYSPRDTVNDAPITIDVPGSGPWSPRNYTNDYAGPVSLADALARSLNVPAVKISEAVGRDIVRNVAEQFGIASDLAAGPALALGASESTLIEMTGAYAGILNGGSAVEPYGLVELRLQGDDAPIMDASGGIRERVIQDRSARQLIWMMHQVVTRGTGQRAQFANAQIAGKTGTTSGQKDAWFIGFTADYVAGVWMGNDDNTPLTGVTGSGLPAEIWRETMARVHSGSAPGPLPMQVPQAPQQTGPRAQAPGAAPPASTRQPETLFDQVLRGLFGNR